MGMLGVLHEHHGGGGRVRRTGLAADLPGLRGARQGHSRSAGGGGGGGSGVGVRLDLLVSLTRLRGGRVAGGEVL